MSNSISSTLFIPHGGGPLPLLGDLFGSEPHQEMISFLQKIPFTIPKPSAIVVISAHWEEEVVTITSDATPPLYYDYYGFPEEAYKIKYPAVGNPLLAKKVYTMLQNAGIKANLDDLRGFDHGMFVPLKIMYPEAKIPCIQISLVKGLDPKTHIQIGKALSKLREENVLILGSGFSFHNLRAFRSYDSNHVDDKNIAFEKWLIKTCTDDALTLDEREKQLTQWSDAPFARYCHPREEHLMPLLVCYGLALSSAKLVFEGNVSGKKASGYLW